MLEAIRRHFRDLGASPSHEEIARATGLQRQHVGYWLDKLQAAGFLTYRRGVARSIVLTDRMANLSDTELRLACVGRGWSVVEPRVPGLSESFPVDPTVPDFGLTLIEALKHIE